MKTNHPSPAYTDPTYQKHKDEAEKRWGNTDAYKQSMERVGRLSRADLERVKQENEAIMQTTAELMEQGFSPTSDEVQKQMQRFYGHLRNFYDPTPELFTGLGKMYVEDPRFFAVYEKRAEGLARFMCEAMAFYADTLLK